jgi:hypothetical protein
MVTLKAYNLAGQLVETLVQGDQLAGRHEVNWSARNLPAGVYLLRLETGGESRITRVIRVR